MTGPTPNYFKGLNVPKGDLTIYMEWRGNGSNQPGYFKTFIDRTDVLSISCNQAKTETIQQNGGYLELCTYYDRYGSSTYLLIKYKISQKISEITKEITGYLPRNVANLGENAAYTTFGRHIDGTWVTHN